MSGTAPDAESGREEGGFTCSALLMCLCLPGISKKKPVQEAISTSPPTAEKAPAPKPQDTPSRAASPEKSSECASPLYSRNNIVFDFVAAEEGDHQPPSSAAQAQQAIHVGYCPSPCFDLPAELISRAGERFGGGVVAADSEATTPVTATFVFDDDGQGRPGGALKKMASCLSPGVDGKSESRLPNLVRFLSASGRSSVPRPLVTPSRDALQGKEVGRDCELGESVFGVSGGGVGASVQRVTTACRDSVV